MPIYEYRCRKCNHVFEAIQHFGSPPPHKCERCGAAGSNLVKLISTSQVVFKGSGFYLTDNRGAKNSSLSGSETEHTSEDAVAVVADKSPKPSKPSSRKDKASGDGGKGDSS